MTPFYISIDVHFFPWGIGDFREMSLEYGELSSSKLNWKTPPKMTHIDKNLTTSRLSPVSPSRHWGAARRGWWFPIGQLSGGWAGGWDCGWSTGQDCGWCGMYPCSTKTQNEGSLGKSITHVREISWDVPKRSKGNLERMYFPIPPEFWWSTVVGQPLHINPPLGMYQEISPPWAKGLGQLVLTVLWSILLC